MLAAENKRWDVMNLLLDFKRPVHVLGNRNRTAGQKQVHGQGQQLTEGGAEVCVRPHFLASGRLRNADNSCLSLACRAGRSDVVAKLLRTMDNEHSLGLESFLYTFDKV